MASPPMDDESHATPRYVEVRRLLPPDEATWLAAELDRRAAGQGTEDELRARIDGLKREMAEQDLRWRFIAAGIAAAAILWWAVVD